MHLDLDAFFAAVEVRDKPSLRGQPVIVGGSGGRGVVATCNYAARALGVGSAMPMELARRKAPAAVILGPRFEAYRESSAIVFDQLRTLSVLVEPLSIDEGYVDLSAPVLLVPGTRPEGRPDKRVSPETAATLAQEVRALVFASTGLSASVGCASSRLMAKIASGLCKPNNFRVVIPGTEASTLAPLPLRALAGIGPVSEAKLSSAGLATLGELAALSSERAAEILGPSGAALPLMARGIDFRPILDPGPSKSISAEETFERNLRDGPLLRSELARLLTKVLARAGAAGLSGRTLTIKLRLPPFQTISRSHTLPAPTDSFELLHALALELLESVPIPDGVRLLGVGISGLGEFVQDTLDFLVFDSAAPPADTLDSLPGPALQRWFNPGADVIHARAGRGWVVETRAQRVAVRFEHRGSPPGPTHTFALDDPALQPAAPLALPQGLGRSR